jgi:hypothetical protein
MRSALIAAFLLVASSAAGQNVWQMNAGIQSQYNSAFNQAFPPRYYYGGGYGYGGYGVRNYRIGSPAWFDRQREISALEDQAWELQRINRNLQWMQMDQQFQPLRRRR